MARQVRISKFMALVLRHDPAQIGLTLDADGWADVDDLLAAAGRHGMTCSRAELDEVVRTNPKQRFTLDAERNRIRANQGHSLEVDLGLTPLGRRHGPPGVLVVDSGGMHAEGHRFYRSVNGV